MFPRLQRLSSSVVTGYSYSEEKEELTLAFPNGRRYVYSDITEDVYLGFLFADSYGKFYNSKIKGNYKATKVM